MTELLFWETESLVFYCSRTVKGFSYRLFADAPIYFLNPDKNFDDYLVILILIHRQGS